MAGPATSQVTFGDIPNIRVVPPGLTTDSLARLAATVRPSPRQIAWQELEFTIFFHFGINTFQDLEWGVKGASPSLFNPVRLDADQWILTAKMAGAKLVILVAKHHDGFCNWPSRFTEYSVKSSPWRNGHGDLVGEVAAACRKHGVKLGIYLSPWDINSPVYGTAAYNQYFLNQLRELLTEYGPVDEVWFDGACGEGPNGKRQVYDWPSYYRLIRELQPQAVIAVMGPDVRWVGTESGYGRETEWSVVPVSDSTLIQIAASSQQSKGSAAFKPPDDMFKEDLGSRERLTHARGLIWYPSEVDVSIRPGWFYHASEDSLVKSPEKLVDIWFSSVGRNSVLLLNLPPDRNGLIHENDIESLRGMRTILDHTFGTDMAGDTIWQFFGDGTATCTMTLEQIHSFDVVRLEENFRNGQRVESFVLEIPDHDGWQEIARGTTIGYRRLLRFSETRTDKIRLTIRSSRARPELTGFGIHKLAGR